MRTRKASVERKVGECYQWKAIGQCSKGDSCSFSHDPASGNRRDKRQEGQSFSLAPKAQIDGRKPSKSTGPRGESRSGRKGQKACKNYIKGTWTNPSCNFRHPPECLIYKSASGYKNGDKCRFWHVEADWQLSKKLKKSGVIGSVALLKESVQFGCPSQDSYPRKSILRKERTLGSNHTVKFSKGTLAPYKNSGIKGPSRGVIQKFEPDECNPCAPKFEERTQDETLHQGRCARRVAWELAKNVYKLKKYW